VPPDAWLNRPVQVIQVLLEERLLLIVDGVNDVVVISDDEHDVLSEDSQLLLSLEKSGDVVRNGDEAKSLNFCPVRDFNHDLVQVTVKVAL